MYSKLKRKLGKSLKRKWESKLLHGQYIKSVDRQLIGGEDTLLRLLRGDLKGQTKIAQQDQTLQTKYHSTKILQTETESK